MNSGFFHLFAPILAFIVNVGFQILGARYVSRFTVLKSVIAGFLIGCVSLIGLELWNVFSIDGLTEDRLAILLANLILYSALGYCYFHFINLGETARRIRILREMYEAKNGLSTREILERYNARQIVTMRIGRLLYNGQIIEHEGRYYIGAPVMLFMARGITFLKLIVLGKKSEFS